MKPPGIAVHLGNCEDATKDFDQYLKRFPDAIFRSTPATIAPIVSSGQEVRRRAEGYEYVIPNRVHRSRKSPCSMPVSSNTAGSNTRKPCGTTVPSSRSPR